MDRELKTDEISRLKDLLKGKNIKISSKEIEDQFDKIRSSQQVFPIEHQRALFIQLLNNYKKTKKKEVIILEELGSKEIPVTVILGTLAEDWPGMSNAILGIIHHEDRNVLFVKGFTVDYKDKVLGVVILSFNINNKNEYLEFLSEKKQLIRKIKDAAKGSADKVLLLDDETIKFGIYNNVIKKIQKMYAENDVENIVGESGEALKFVSSRSREYLEERKITDLAKLIIDNYRFQKMIRMGTADAKIKINNFDAKYEKLTGITFVGREKQSSIEDLLQTLKFIVPDHTIKHQKSFVTTDGLLVYRIEIVDRNENPISPELIKSIERSFEKMIIPAYSKSFSLIKSVGGFEHYARAIIPFLMEELKRTDITQVFINSEKKTDFSIHIKLIIVSYLKNKDLVCDLVSKLGKHPGIGINSLMPPKMYAKNIGINILKLSINLAEFSSINEVFSSLKKILKKLYGKIRDFDEGFREIEIRILNDLLKKLEDINPSLVKEIFFNFDELYRIENPVNLLVEVIKLCSKSIEKSNLESGEKIIFKYKNLSSFNRTLIVISFQKYKKILSKIIKKLKGIEIYFTKIEWNQRTYLIMILSKNRQVLEKDLLNELRHDIKNFLK